MGEYKQKLVFTAALIGIATVIFLSLQIKYLNADNSEMQREINRLNVEKYTLCLELNRSICTYTIN